MKDKRNYNYLCVIYEDDENFENQMDHLLYEKEVIYIRHDQDVTEEGELKKPHYHFVIKLKTACTLSALARRVGVSENMVEPVKKSLNASLKYLIHYKDDNKYNYDLNEVKSNSEKLLKRFRELVLDETPGGEHAMSIQEYIESIHDFVKMSQIGAYANKNGIWNYFIRYYSYIRDIVKEHNADVCAKRYHSSVDYTDLY